MLRVAVTLASIQPESMGCNSHVSAACLNNAIGLYVHLFPANLGDSACISEIVQAISAVRQFGGRSGMIRQPQCRNWLHFYRITCRLSKIGRKKV